MTQITSTDRSQQVQAEWAGGIRQAVFAYFHGVHEGDEHKLRTAFHPDARVVGAFDGKATDMSMDDFVGLIKGMASDASKGLEMQKWILSMDVVGPHAVVRARVRSGDRWFNDFLVLGQGQSGWQIRFKTFNDADPNQAPKE